MKVVYLTAGAAGMYCGSCLRDNALVAALRADGREVRLVPLYTPIRTDEEDVSEPFVLYGAINVYLQHRSRVFRRTPPWLDRVLDAPALLRRVVRGTDGASGDLLGELTVSLLEGRGGRQGKELERVLCWLATARPDLVNLPNAMFVHLARPIREALGVPVLCTLSGEDLYLDTLPEAWRSRVLALIRREQREVDGFVATSRYYAEHCRGLFEIVEERLHTVLPGVCVDADEPRAELPAEPFTIGYLARICPAKGLHLLVDAVSRMLAEGRRVRLVVAGYLPVAERAYLDDVRRRVAATGPAGAFTYLGEVDRVKKRAMLRSLHVLSVPTVYREAKGLYVLEALAQGVPVVQPRHGAFCELVESTGGGVLVEPGDVAALAEGLARLMENAPLRRELGERGRAAVLASFTDRAMAERTWAVYATYAGKKGEAQ